MRGVRIGEGERAGNSGIEELRDFGIPESLNP
jgi:hypothetical protein